MANNISESSKKTNATEKASSSGKMGGSMMASGFEESRAAQASTPTIMVSAERVSGKTESARSG